MSRVAKLIVEHRKIVLAVFLVLAAAGAVLSLLVSINYDMTDYLPQESPSTVAISIIQDEFGEDIPNARVMLTGVTIREALEYKEKLSAIPGVSNVSWLDDVLGKDYLLSTPVEVLDHTISKNYYLDEKALFNVAIGSGQESTAIKDIYDLLGDRGAVSGDAANSNAFQSMTVHEVLKAMAFVIPIIFIILAFSTTSWLEPVLFMSTIGVAVLINMGTTAFFGEISFITQTVTPILQLAVSMDYAIFLLHSFKEYRKDHEPKEAMVLAMKRPCRPLRPAPQRRLSVFGPDVYAFRNWFRLGHSSGQGCCLELPRSWFFCRR